MSAEKEVEEVEEEVEKEKEGKFFGFGILVAATAAADWMSSALFFWGLSSLFPPPLPPQQPEVLELTSGPALSPSEARVIRDEEEKWRHRDGQPINDAADADGSAHSHPPSEERGLRRRPSRTAAARDAALALLIEPRQPRRGKR